MPNNTLNLKQKDGGRRIKQADQSSVLAYQLYDEYFNTIPDIEGMTATVKLYQEDIVRYQTEADVTAGRVGFKIAEPIPAGVYIVEITVGGYVFPSDRATTLEVVAGATKFEIKELVPLDLNDKLAEIERLISQSQHADLSGILADISSIKEQMANMSSYDDTELRESIRALEGRIGYDDQPLRDLIDNLKQSIPQAYDDTSIRELIDEVKQSIPQSYDDTALIGRIQALEEHTDNDTVYDDTKLKQRVQTLEEIDLSEYAKRSELTTFDNSENERRLEDLESRPSASYDDAAIKKLIANLNDRIDRLPIDKRLEYQQEYLSLEQMVARGFSSANNTLSTVTFKKPFSRRPDHINITLDIQSGSTRVQYINNVTKDGFDCATNYGPDLKGVWYEGWLNP